MLVAVAALLAGLISVVAAVTGATSASAAPLGTTPTVTQDPLPTVQINGVVWAQATVGNTVYAVGNFSSARPAGSPLGTNETPRANILAYDITTGVLSTTFVHTLNAQAQSIAVSPDGSRIYVAGNFTQVDGVVRSRLAAFSTADGSLLPWAPAPNATVYGITATSDTIYFGGTFSAVGGVARSRAAAVDTNGAVRTWAPNVSNTVRAVAFVPGTSRVYLGGHFLAVNGQAVRGLAGVDPITGASVATPAAAALIASDGTTGSGVLSLKTDGNLVYGTGFDAARPGVKVEGSYAVRASTGAIEWYNNCWGDSYDAVPVAGVLYVASHAHNCAAVGAFPDGTYHSALAWDTQASTRYNTIDSRGWDYRAYRTSTLLQWNPSFVNGSVQGQSVWGYTGNAKYVAAGGEFPKVNGLAQQGLVRFAVHSAAPNKFGPTGLGTPSIGSSRVGETTVVSVSAQSAYDPDDGTLAYSLIRDGDTAHPVATTTLPTVGFWEQDSRPIVTLTDTTAAVGSTHSYRIAVTDGGNVTSTSPAVTTTVSTANLALGKPATQSTTGGAYKASLANDGNTSASSFSYTQQSLQPWWQVDLQGTQPIQSVAIWSSADANNLSNYWVFVSAKPFNTALTPTQQAATAGVWSSHQTTPATRPTTVNVAAGVTGRYVMIVQARQFSYLTLSEVEVR